MILPRKDDHTSLHIAEAKFDAALEEAKAMNEKVKEAVAAIVTKTNGKGLPHREGVCGSSAAWKDCPFGGKWDAGK